MKERLEKVLLELDKRRAEILNEYILALEVKEWGVMDSLNAIGPAQRLHDIDKHITNITLEIKRMELTNG